MLTNPDKFASEFNNLYPGAYRTISTRDVLGMKICGLVGRYDIYLRDDLETIRGILQYEKLREGHLLKIARRSKAAKPKCKLCRKSLPAKPMRKVGRPREYCPGCDSSRNTERYRKWRKLRLENKGR